MVYVTGDVYVPTFVPRGTSIAQVTVSLSSLPSEYAAWYVLEEPYRYTGVLPSWNCVYVVTSPESLFTQTLFAASVLLPLVRSLISTFILNWSLVLKVMDVPGLITLLVWSVPGVVVMLGFPEATTYVYL